MVVKKIVFTKYVNVRVCRKVFLKNIDKADRNYDKKVAIGGKRVILWDLMT